MPASPGEVSARRPSGVDRGGLVAAAVFLPAALVATGLLDATLATDASRAPHALVAVGLFVTAFGTSGYMFACSAAVAAIAVIAIGRGHVRWNGIPLRLAAERSTYVFAAVAASGIAAQVMKHLLGRARPVLLRVDGPFSFHPLSLANDLASFPSGHATSAFAAAVALGLLSPRRRPWLLGSAALIGMSRVVVGAHYPSDVVGGAALGSLAAVAVARFCARRDLAFEVVAGRPVPKRPGAMARRRSIES